MFVPDSILASIHGVEQIVGVPQGARGVKGLLSPTRATMKRVCKRVAERV
jgi:hypothetical protein